MNKLRNLGPVSWRMLSQAGIGDVETLRDVGPATAFIRVLEYNNNASLNLLYAMAAGLEDRDWRELSADEKGTLIREFEDLRELLSRIGKQV